MESVYVVPELIPESASFLLELESESRKPKGTGIGIREFGLGIGIGDHIEMHCVNGIILLQSFMLNEVGG